MKRPFPAYKGDEPYVFVSYSHNDESAVYSELAWLKEAGLNIWYDDGIVAGSEWTEVLAGAIKRAALILYFVSPASVRSQNCRNELNYAVEQNQPIIAVHLEKADLTGGLSLTLSSRQAVLKYGLSNKEYQEKLLSGIATHVVHSRIPPAVSTKTYTPHILSSAALVILIVFFWLYQNERSRTDSTDTPPAAEYTSNTSNYSELEKQFSIEVRPFSLIVADDRMVLLAESLEALIAERLSGRLAYWGETIDFDLRVLSPKQRALLVQSNNQQENASRLQVAYVLEADIRLETDMARIAAQVVQIKDGKQIWSADYKVSSEASFEEQRAISNEISSEVRFLVFKSVVVENRDKFAQYKGIKPEALALFSEVEGKPLTLRIKLLERVVELDPNFANAFSLLSVLYVYSPDDDRLAKALAANDRAIELRENNAFAWCARGDIFLNSLDYRNAEHAYEECISIDSSGIRKGSMALARISIAEGRIDEAIERIDTATAMSVEESATQLEIARLRLAVGDYEQALFIARRKLEDNRMDDQQRDQAIAVELIALIKLGETEQARALSEENPAVTSRPFVRLVRQGTDEEWLSHFESQFANRRYADMYGLRFGVFSTHLRDEPRYLAVLKKMDGIEQHTERFEQVK